MFIIEENCFTRNELVTYNKSKLTESKLLKYRKQRM